MIGEKVTKARKISGSREKQGESPYKHSSRSYEEKFKDKDRFKHHQIKIEKGKQDSSDREIGSPPLKRYLSSSGDKLPSRSERKGSKDLGTQHEDHYDHERYSDRHDLRNEDRRSTESVKSQGYRRSSTVSQRHNETDIQHPSKERRRSREHDEWEPSSHSERRRSDYREDDSYHSKDKDSRRLSLSSKDFVTDKPYAKEDQYPSSNKASYQETRDMRAGDDMKNHSRSRKKFETDTMAEQPYAQENQHSSGRKTYKETTVNRALDEHITEDERYYESMKNEHEYNSSKDYGVKENSRRIPESDFIVSKDTHNTPTEHDLMEHEAYIRGTHSRNQMPHEPYGNIEGYEGFRRETDTHSETAERGSQGDHYNFPDRNNHSRQELSPEKEKSSDFYDYGHEQPSHTTDNHEVHERDIGHAYLHTQQRQYRNDGIPPTEDFGGHGHRNMEVSQSEYDYQYKLKATRGGHSEEEYQHPDEIMPLHDEEGMSFRHRRGNKFARGIDHTDDQHFEPDYQGPMDQERYEADHEQRHADFQGKYPSGNSSVLFDEICYALMYSIFY